MASNSGSDVSKYETEEGLKEVAAFLRGRNGMPLRPAIEVDKRVEYFKGEPLARRKRRDLDEIKSRSHTTHARVRSFENTGWMHTAPTNKQDGRAMISSSFARTWTERAMPIAG